MKIATWSMYWAAFLLTPWMHDFRDRFAANREKWFCLRTTEGWWQDLHFWIWKGVRALTDSHELKEAHHRVTQRHSEIGRRSLLRAIINAHWFSWDGIFVPVNRRPQQFIPKLRTTLSSAGSLFCEALHRAIRVQIAIINYEGNFLTLSLRQTVLIKPPSINFHTQLRLRHCSRTQVISEPL